jgi:hypothetical protein
MKKIFFHITIICVSLITSCSKQSDPSTTAPPSFNSVKSPTILGTWGLTTYTITTDGIDYQFNGSDISSHALRVLAFRNESYEAADSAWSGTYEYVDDSSKIKLTPVSAGFEPVNLDIDYLLVDQLHLSSPEVMVNPIDPNATDYEKFVAAQGLSWLQNRNIDISDIRTVKIQFAYYLKHRE